MIYYNDLLKKSIETNNFDGVKLAIKTGGIIVFTTNYMLLSIVKTNNIELIKYILNRFKFYIDYESMEQKHIMIYYITIYYQMQHLFTNLK